MKAFFYTQRRSPEEIQKWIDARRKALEEIRQRRAEELAKTPKPTSKAASYLAAEARHAWGGPASVEVFEERLRLCMECPGRVDELEGQRDQGGVGFCTKCGCGANKRSQLSVKLTLAGVPCPLGKFSAVDGTGGTISSAVEAAKGVAANVLAQLRKAIG